MKKAGVGMLEKFLGEQDPLAWIVLKHGSVPFGGRMGLGRDFFRVQWYKVQTRFLSRYRGVYFIHIGKCGGSSLSRYLCEHSGVRHVVKAHCAKPLWRSEMDYVTCVRSPLSRFVSAFNWRLQEIRSGRPHEQREVDEYDYFQTPNRLAEALSDDALRGRALAFLKTKQVRQSHPEHTEMGINWYLGDLIDRSGFLGNLHVVRQEHLVEDIGLLSSSLSLEDGPGIPSIREGDAKTAEVTALSPEAVENLLRHYEDDYVVLRKLVDCGLIDQEYYRRCRSYPYPEV